MWVRCNHAHEEWFYWPAVVTQKQGLGACVIQYFGSDYPKETVLQSGGRLKRYGYGPHHLLCARAGKGDEFDAALRAAKLSSDKGSAQPLKTSTRKKTSALRPLPHNEPQIKKTLMKRDGGGTRDRKSVV